MLSTLSAPGSPVRCSNSRGPSGPSLQVPVLGHRDAGADEAPGPARLVDRRDQAVARPGQ